MESCTLEAPKNDVVIISVAETADKSEAETADKPEAETADKPVAEPEKPTLIQKLREKRWTFKLKNNFTEYVTVEPLICFYMLQIFVESLIEPYHFHKACLSLEEDTYFCNVITINSNEIYQPCAMFSDLDDVINCKGLSRKTDKVNCDDVYKMYERNLTKVFAKPEDFRLCTVIDKATDTLYVNKNSVVGISATMLSFFVVMIVSIWSDKYSKRKICLILPILGQLLTSIINLHGALSNYLSFDSINSSNMIISSLSGGMTLFLFGCFSYMNDETIRRKLLFRFGIISLILTVYRYIPKLYSYLYQYYRDDDSYLNLIIINLVFNIICLLYVKVILNESKREVATVTAPIDCSRSINNSEVQSVGKDSTARKYAKRKQLAKAFNLDVVWDYVLLVFKKRIHSGRKIIIIFLVIILADKMSPYDLRVMLRINDNFVVDSIDIDGVIFVIISITMLLHRISDVLIAILVIGIPTASRLILAVLGNYIFDLEVDSAATDFYTPFKRIASCSLLLAHVDKSESRIFLIVQAIANLPNAVTQILETNDNLYTSIQRSTVIIVVLYFLLPLVVFCGLGYLYYINRKVKNLRKKEYFKFTNENKIGKEQSVIPAPVFINGHEELSTHL